LLVVDHSINQVPLWKDEEIDAANDLGQIAGTNESLPTRTKLVRRDVFQYGDIGWQKREIPTSSFIEPINTKSLANPICKRCQVRPDRGL